MSKINKLFQRENTTPHNYDMPEFDIDYDRYDFVSMHCGAYHTIGVKSDGTVWATGDNQYGQLGLGHTTSKQYFTKVDITNVKEVVCRQNTTYVLKNDNTLWACGRNNQYQMGLNNNTQQNTFVQIPIDNIKEVHYGQNHLAVTKTDGTIWVTGDNGYGQLCNGGTTDNKVFTELVIDNLSEIVWGANHVIIKKVDGTVWGCGQNTSGQLGIGTTTNATSFTKIDIDNVKDIYCGLNHTIITKNDGTVWGTGANNYGQLGLNSTTNQSSFVQITTNIDNFNTFFLMHTAPVTFMSKKDGTLHVCGRNNNGRLSYAGTASTIKVFTQFVTPARVTGVTSSDNHSFLMFDGAPIEFAGSNGKFQIGCHPFQGLSFAKYTKYEEQEIKDYNHIFSFNNEMLIANDSGDFVETVNKTKIAAGYRHSLILDEYKKLYIAGLVYSTSSYSQMTFAILLDGKDIRDIYCGGDVSFFVKNDGTLWACGLNQYGQLGLGNTTNQDDFVQVTTNINNDVKYVACGGIYSSSYYYGFTYIIKEDGTLYSTGYNGYGQLGLGNTTNQTTFTKVNITDVKKVACGMYHTLLLKNDGTVWFCGSNSSNQSGLNSSTSQYTSFTSVNMSDVKDIACGNHYSVILKNDGTVWVCGLNGNGQLGTSDTANKNTWTQAASGVKRIFCSYCGYNTYIIKNNGQIMGCGSNAYGQLNSTDTNNKTSFTSIATNMEHIDLVAGHSYTFLLRNDGSILSTGYNYNGQLGLGDNVNKTGFTTISSPKRLTKNYITDELKIENIAQVRAGYLSTYVITKAGNLYSCGYNGNGELGLGDTSSRSILTKVPLSLDADDKPIHISAGINGTLLVTKKGYLYATGYNGNGRLGLTVGSTYNKFTKVNITDVKQAEVSTYSSILVKNDGTVWAAGVNNSWGQLGFGDFNDRLSFTQVTIDANGKAINDVIQVACSHAHNHYILRSDGTVWGTGGNQHGQLGTNDTSYATYFTKATTNNSNIKKIIAYGSYYSTYQGSLLCLKNDGTVWACGNNIYGQLGTGDTNNSLTLKKVISSNVKDISAAHFSAAAVKNDGTVYFTGVNSRGLMGTGSTNTYLTSWTKSKITDAAQVSTFASGYNYDAGHSIVLKNNGSVYCSGMNSNGQLGINNTTTMSEYIKTSLFVNDNIKYNKTDKILNLYRNESLTLLNNKKLQLTAKPGMAYNKTLGSLYNSSLIADNDLIDLPYDSIKQVSVSKTHAFILLYDGTVYGCGSNTYGQLFFDRTTTTVANFTQLPISGVLSIAAGDNFTMFIDSAYILKSLGLNTSYQLGLGDTSEQTGICVVPNMGLSKWVECSDKSTFVITQDNALWVQGYNNKGLFGIGSDTLNQTVINFTRSELDVKSIEILIDHTRIRKLDDSLWICGKKRPSYHFADGDSANIYVFNEVQIPENLKDVLITYDIGHDDNVYAIFQIESDRSSIEIINKSISSIDVKINNNNNDIYKVDMIINDELISSSNVTETNLISFIIPNDKILLGQNILVFKAYSSLGHELYGGAKIIKSENSICINAGETIIVNSKKYKVLSVSDVDDRIMVVLEGILTDNISKGDIIRKTVNDISMFVQTNNDGIYKEMEYVGLEFVPGGYKETYTYYQNDMVSASLKIQVNKGNEYTTLKDPTIKFERQHMPEDDE